MKEKWNGRKGVCRVEDVLSWTLLLDLILRFSTVQIQVAFILPTTGTNDEEESSWYVRLRNRSLPVPGGLPGCRSVSTTALTAARYISL